MRRLSLTLGILLIACAPAFSLAVPDVLVAQHLVSFKKDDTDPNVPMADLLSDELYQDGRVNPILWSTGDPIFRAAVDDGLIKNTSSAPDLKTAFAVQKTLKAEYLFLVESTRAGDLIKGTVTLYKGGKPIWANTQSIGATSGGKFDLTFSLRSIAHTWRTLVGVGPLKDLAVAPPLATPPPDPGKLTPPPSDPMVDSPPTRGSVTDNSILFRDADGLLKEGKTAQAIGMLREGVDTDPMNLERRKKLAEMLMAAGEPVLAAQEARRGARLVPNGTELRVLAARAWLLAGNGEEAQNDLNELAAHNPQGADRLLMAEAALFQLRLTQAIDLLDNVIAQKPTPEAFYYRSLAEALQANGDASTADAKQGGSGDIAPRYAIAMSALDTSSPKVGDEIRSLFDAAGIKQAKELTDGLAFQIARATATKGFLEALPPDPIHKASHERRILAYNLLIQCLADVQDYLTSRSEDTISDARLNFGEALKHFRGAHEDFLNEAKGGAKSDSTP